MENEVSGIAKLGIVLIALAILIGLGFGIFQISKSTANSGVNNVQGELDSVSSSAFSTYDQTNITGTMASSAVSDFEGESVAVLIATRAWANCLNDAKAVVGSYSTILDMGSGLNSSFAKTNTEDKGVSLPIVWAYTGKGTTDTYKMYSSEGTEINGAFINYNAILGGCSEVKSEGSEKTITTTNPSGTTEQIASINGDKVYMAYINFDSNCYRCTSGFATGASGKVLFNNIIGNLSKTGRTEYIPSGAKFESYLIKDSSGTNMGVVFEQINT